MLSEFHMNSALSSRWQVAKANGVADGGSLPDDLHLQPWPVSALTPSQKLLLNSNSDGCRLSFLVARDPMRVPTSHPCMEDQAKIYLVTQCEEDI